MRIAFRELVIAQRADLVQQQLHVGLHDAGRWELARRDLAVEQRHGDEVRQTVVSQQKVFGRNLELRPNTSYAALELTHLSQPVQARLRFGYVSDSGSPITR